MTDLRTAAQQALEALEQDNPAGRTATITALRAALAEPVQEPEWEVRVDGTSLRKNRWEIGIRRIVALLWGNRREFEIDEVVEAVRGLVPNPYAEGDAAKSLDAALAEDALQRLTDVQQELEAALYRCPQCRGPADNGYDRSIPPSPYFCTKCMAEPVQEPDDEPTYCSTCGEEDGGTTCGMPDCGLRCGAEPVQEPTPMPPFPPVSLWKRGCAVCGIGAGGHVYGYVCPRSDCPTRVTCGGTV